MAVMTLVGQELRVRFAAWERLAVGRGQVVVPLSAVREVEYVERPLARPRGGRAAVVIAGVLKVGVWGLGTGARRLVSVRRTTPAVRLSLTREACGGRVDELLVSVENARQLVDAVSGRRVSGT